MSKTCAQHGLIKTLKRLIFRKIKKKKWKKNESMKIKLKIMMIM